MIAGYTPGKTATVSTTVYQLWRTNDDAGALFWVGINLAISDQATINTGTEQVNLWQRNMFAVRVEAEVGFVVRDAAAFVKLTDATS